MLNMKAIILALCITCLLFSCDDETVVKERTYQMGFQNSAPRFDNIELFIQSLNLWTTRADAAIISIEVPWEELLNGGSAVNHVVNNYKGLVEYYRNRGLTLWVYVDPQNGLDRSSDARELVAAGKSIANTDAQNIYRRFVVVMDSVLSPAHLGLALETNLIRAAASPAIYNGVKQAATLAAADIRSVNATVKLSVSVQAEQAWGKFTGTDYQGIAQDFVDFPFIEELGISSYPYFGFDQPEAIPHDYYTRLVAGKNISVFISEGGWSSQSLTINNRTIGSSPEIQRRYIEYHQHLLDGVKATAYFQLVFTDIDVASLPPGAPQNLPYFLYLGMVDKQLEKKPALDAWDEIFAVPLTK
jgi:hypothetical protein